MIAALALTGMLVSVPAGDASVTITELSRQLHLQVLFDYPLIKGHETVAVECDCVPADAFHRLLSYTGLTYQFVNYRTLTVTDPAVRRFDIPAGAAPDSLIAWSTQADFNLVGNYAEAITQHTPAIDAVLDPLAALEQLLAGTNLRYYQVTRRTVSITAKPPVRRPIRKRPVIQASSYASSYTCSCAQTWEGISLGNWCYENNQVTYAPSCGGAP